MLFFNMYCFSSESDLDNEISSFVLVGTDDISKKHVSTSDASTQVFEDNFPSFQTKSHENCFTQCYRKAELCIYFMTNYFIVNSQKKQ